MKQESTDSRLVRYKFWILQDKGFEGKAPGCKNGCGLFARSLPGVDIRGYIGLVKPQPEQQLREPLKGAASDVNRFQVCPVHPAAAAVRFFFEYGLEIHILEPFSCYRLLPLPSGNRRSLLKIYLVTVLFFSRIEAAQSIEEAQSIKAAQSNEAEKTAQTAQTAQEA